jgi:hypothetical protein
VRRNNRGQRVANATDLATILKVAGKLLLQGADYAIK